MGYNAVWIAIAIYTEPKWQFFFQGLCFLLLAVGPPLLRVRKLVGSKFVCSDFALTFLGHI